MKILFIIPTFFARPQINIKAITSLASQTGNKIIIVHDTRFTHDDKEIKLKLPPNSVLTQVHNVPLGGAINYVVKTFRTDEDVICWIHDDMIIHDKHWIKDYKRVLDYFGCGAVGIRTHTFSKIKQVTPDLSEVTWTDGILMCHYDLFKKLNGIDERYLADCETQDFCFRIRKLGYTIYRLVVKAKHLNINFGDRKKDKDFWDNVLQSRKLFWKRWEFSGENTKGFASLDISLRKPSR